MQRPRTNSHIPKKKVFLSQSQISTMLSLFFKGVSEEKIAEEIGSSTRQVKKHIHDFCKSYTKEFTDKEYTILLEETRRGVLKDGEIAKKIGTKSYVQVRNEKRKKKFQKDFKEYCELEKNIQSIIICSSDTEFDMETNDLMSFNW